MLLFKVSVHVADLLFLVHLVAVQNAAEDYAGAVKARPSVLLIFATSDLNLQQPQMRAPAWPIKRSRQSW
jgi:hypothetical protein